jgi:hypothetical protein
MAIKLNSGKYACGYCRKEYADAVDAENCKDSHDLIYVPFTKEDLNRLLLFIYTNNEDYLTHTMLNTLNKYKGKGTYPR